MTKLKLISAVAAVLLILNILGLFFMLSHKPPRSPREVIIEKLHFDKSQVQEYEKLIEIHKEQVRKFQDETLPLKNALYGTLTSETQPEIRDSVIQKLGEIQIKIEETHYQHFKDIQQLCKENQRQDFDLLTKDLAGLFSMPMPKHHKR